MRLVRIREAKPLDNYRVQLTLTDGRVVERDLGPMLVGPVFAEIRNDEARFREMRVEGGTLVWPAGADLCPCFLLGVGFPPAEAVAVAAWAVVDGWRGPRGAPGPRFSPMRSYILLL